MKDFIYGFKKGIPIMLGYLAISFAFGVTAVRSVSPLVAVIISITNLTGSGQFAGVTLIGEAASYIEIAVTVLLINLRYILMAISLSQKMDPSIPTWKRFIMAYGVTDEAFAVAITDSHKITFSYYVGIVASSWIGWITGTALGAFGASIIPDRLLDALGIGLYAMFIALFVPHAKKSFNILIVVLIAIACSCIFEYVPYIKEIGIGIKIIVSTIIASVIGALIFPLQQPKSKEEAS